MSSVTVGTGALVLRVLLAFILGRASLHKWRDRERFTAQLRAYRLLPQSMVAPVALALATVESATALGALNPSWPVPALLAAALFALYGAAMAINLVRGRRDLDCGCGGPLARRTTIDSTLVARNVCLAAIALLVASASAMPVDAALWPIVLPASAAMLLIYESAGQAVANRQQVLAWKR